MTFALCLVWHMCDKFNRCCWNFDYNAKWAGAAAWWTAKKLHDKAKAKQTIPQPFIQWYISSHISYGYEANMVFFPPPTPPRLPAKLFVVCRCCFCFCCCVHTRLTILRLSSHRSVSWRTNRANLFGSVDMCRLSIFQKASQCTFMSKMCPMHTY